MDLGTMLAGGGLLIIDGGMGSQLQREGVAMDGLVWSARANLEQPGAVQRVHEEYIRAGAEVIIANTFAAGRATLEPAGLGDRVAEANRSAMRAAMRAREAAAAGPVVVAGSMSWFSSLIIDPAGLALAAEPRLPGLADFREQAGLLAEGGADLIALEMINTAGSGSAAMQAAAETGLPVWLGVSPVRGADGAVRTLAEGGGGGLLEDLLRALLAGPAPAAVTVMHSRPEVIPDAIEIVRGQFAGPVGVYAETGGWEAPNWVFDGLTPAQYRSEAAVWADRGAQLIGGCCGTGPEHIRLLADGLARQGRPAG